jgi:hypothetical protein
MTRSGLSKCGAVDPWALDRFVADGALSPGSARGGAGIDVWSKCFGDKSQQYPVAVAIDGAGHVVVTGYLHDAVDFGNGRS